MKSKEKWLVAVTAGKWQTHGIREAKSAGIRILAIDGDPNAEGFKEADEFIHIDLMDHNAVIDSIKKINVTLGGAVSFCSEAGMTLAAKIRQEFDLPGVRPDLCELLLNKALQRKIWSEKNVPGPDWKVYYTVESALEAIKKSVLPVIIKPTDSSGSRGVTKIESLEDDINDAVNRAFSFSKNNNVIVESFMDGTEFTVEVFAANDDIHVLAVTEKKKVEGTRGTVARELATSSRKPEVIKSIANAVVQAFQALGYMEGPGHAEVILMKDDKVGLVEVAGRGGGFMVFDKFVPAVSGVNIARLTALQAVGLPVGPIKIKRDAAVLRFFPSTPGTLVAINGLEVANKIEGVEANAFVKTGQKFSRATADGDRLGYILSKAATPQQAQELADRAESIIDFHIKSEN